MPDDFTPEEDEILRKYYGKVPLRGTIQEMLWGRSESQIIKRIQVLGLKHGVLEYMRHYSDQDLEYLRENYADAPWEELTERLGRSKRNLTYKANKLGLKRNRKKQIRRVAQESTVKHK